MKDRTEDTIGARYLALESRRGKELLLSLGRILEDGYRGRPRVFLKSH